MRIKIQYATKKYCTEEIERAAERILVICREMASGADKKVSGIEIITEEEKAKILTDFNATEAEYPREKTVAELFEYQAEKNPEKVCYVCDGRSITYGELNRRANEIAYKLRELGVKPNEFVGIVTDRSVEMAVSIAAVLKSGGAYVPIDPKYPEERIRFMLEDSKPKAVIKYTQNEVNIPDSIEIIEPEKYTEGTDKNPEKIKTQDDICNEVGIYDNSYMCRLFKEFENVTPDEYRKNWVE